MLDISCRRDGEEFTDYFVRLFEHKKEYELSCDEIANLLNTEDGSSYTESKWRKEYASFDRGRQYERKQLVSNIAQRILVIGDLHVPFQKPVETFSQYVGRIDTIVINGDVLDAMELSKFSKLYRSSPMDEIVQARQYLIDLINLIRPKSVFVLYGNHDIRLQSYISHNIDNDIAELIPRTPLDLIVDDGFYRYDKQSASKTWYEPIKDAIDGVRIVYVNNWYYQIGKTIFCHPLAFSSVPMKTAIKAIEFFRNQGFVFTSLVMAHTHRVGSYTIGNTVAYESGACCETARMKYSDGKLTFAQKEGFLYLAQDESGEVLREHTKQIYLN